MIFFFFIWVFFHEHSRFAGQQGKGEDIYLTPLYHFDPLHGHLDISRAIAAGSSPLGFRAQVANHQATRPLSRNDETWYGYTLPKENPKTI